MRRLVNFAAIAEAQLVVAVDAMYGAGRIYLARLLRDAGCQVHELRSEMNPASTGSIQNRSPAILGR
ncbi:MAG UNVERIFIED_CONTAM: hypothetical protein LVT10_11710 [Anaerolineae bacterium]